MRLPDGFKRITGDFVINILASVIYTFARQIVVFPLLAARLTDADYGTLLTIVGLANVCTALVGGTLNNIRLVQESRYQAEGLDGDFILLNLLGGGISIVFSLALWLAFGYNWLTAVLLTAFILISNLYHYASAHFRLELNFKRILWVNILMSLAYIVATFFFATKLLWPAVFLVGESAGLLYTVCTTPLLKETVQVTPLMRETAQKMLVLMLSNLIANLLMYADRMILYPILGAESVSYYSTASFFGKSAGIVMTPIAGVLLGYFAQKNFSASKKLFTLINGLSLLSLTVFMGGCWLLAPWFTSLLYPTLYAESAPYIMQANLGAVVGIAGNMAQPMVLKCCSTRWILLIQLVYASVYLACSMLWLPVYSLLGFCWTTITANTIRLLLLYAVGYWKF